MEFELSPRSAGLPQMSNMYNAKGAREFSAKQWN